MRVIVSLGSIVFMSAVVSSAVAQSPTPAPTRATSEVMEKMADAAALVGPAPRIDGLLDDSAWSLAPPIVDFIQKAPLEGSPPTERTEVRILYDHDALYIGARMYRKDPRLIRRSVTRRDGDSDAEVFIVSLDTYLDRRTAYSFSISSGGVRKDYHHSQDAEGSGLELQFDPVWKARVRVDALGWTAEMRIPFSQLRFSTKAEQVWGMELHRGMPDKNEDDYWVLIPAAATGFPSHFGKLRGISGMRQTRRLELLPYTAGNFTVRGNPDPANPFNQSANARAGADLKMGLGPNLTLDATANPDFGQVEADPAVVNLTAFETVFDERRPFFIEGSENLIGRGLSFLGRPLYFYSRRIGAPPHGSPSATYIDSPGNTTILGATKVTGRLASGLSIGALSSVTPRVYADTYSGSFGRVPVEPPTGFGVIRLQQEIGRQHSALGWTLTDVTRSVDTAGALNALLVRHAYAGGTDWRFRFMDGMYEFTGFAGFSRLDGDTAAINRVQSSSAHSFQRPDQTHVQLNPTLTSLSGYTVSVRGDKNAGRFSVWGIQVAARSPGFEINDLGQMRRADAIDFHVDYSVRDTKPHRLLQYWQAGLNVNGTYNYGWERQPTTISQSSSITLHNFFKVAVATTLTPRALSDELTRGGPSVQTPRKWNWQATGSTKAGAKYQGTATASYGIDELGDWNYQVTGSLLVRAAPRWQFQVSPVFIRALNPQQYVATVAGGSAATFGSRYLFGFIDQSQISSQFRINYAFTPDLTLEGYAEPFAASGRYSRIGEVSTPRQMDLRTYGASGTGTTLARTADSVIVTDGVARFAVANPDFNRLSFRSNLVLRWEWARGSTLFLIWQQNRSSLLTLGDAVRPGSLWNATTAPGDNFLAIKVTYWIAAK